MVIRSLHPYWMAAILLSLPTLAQASLIRVDWSAVIYSSPSSAVAEIGDSISGSYLYDTNSPVLTSSPTSVRYATNHAMTFALNGSEFFSRTGEIAVSNDTLICPTRACFIVDELDVISRNFSGQFSDGSGVNSLSMSFLDLSRTPLQDTSLPVTDPPFSSNFLGGILFLSEGGLVRFEDIEDTYTLVGTVSSPASLALMLLALGLHRLLPTSTRRLPLISISNMPPN